MDCTDMTPWPFNSTWLVGCRVDGAIQHYNIESKTHEEAQEAVAEGVLDARAVLVRVK